VPPPLVLGPGTPLDAQAALDRLFARCREDEHCAAQFGDPRRTTSACARGSRASPFHLSLPDPRSGEPES
jgi:hypothetical protein